MIDLILIAITVPGYFILRLLFAIHAACFYAKGTVTKSKLLERCKKNLHYVQTPLWYFIFVPYGILLFAIFNDHHPGIVYSKGFDFFWINLINNTVCSYLISAGTSAMCGPLYQGYINLGGGEPFVNPNEKREYESANPITGKIKIKKKFWYGKRRIYLAFVGLAEVIIGLMIIFKTT